MSQKYLSGSLVLFLLSLVMVFAGPIEGPALRTNNMHFPDNAKLQVVEDKQMEWCEDEESVAVTKDGTTKAAYRVAKAGAKGQQGQGNGSADMNWLGLLLGLAGNMLGISLIEKSRMQLGLKTNALIFFHFFFSLFAGWIVP